MAGAPVQTFGPRRPEGRSGSVPGAGGLLLGGLPGFLGGALALLRLGLRGRLLRRVAELRRLDEAGLPQELGDAVGRLGADAQPVPDTEIGSASCRGRVCPYLSIWVVAVSLKKKKYLCVSDIM